jgi:glycosyltransferase involved in cell wall biosynthesis
MNILIIEDTASSSKGGAEKSMRYFCEYLSKQQNVNIFFSYHNEGDLTKRPKSDIYCSLKQINLYPLRQIGLFNWFKGLFQLIKYCKSNKIDIVFTHIIHAFFILRIAKALAGFKLFQYFKWNSSTNTIGILGGWGLKGVDEAYAVSEFTMSYWKRLNNDFNIKNVISDGIPDNNYSGDNIYKKNDIITILFAGRIYEGKGLHILLESFKYLKSGKFELNICGTFSSADDSKPNSYKQLIFEQIDTLKNDFNINLLGYQSDMVEFIEEASLVIVPSILADAQPLVLLESMRQKKLCIGSRVGGIPEIFTGELEILIFEPNDAKKLADKILEIVDLNDHKKVLLKKRLFNRFESKYSLKNTNETLFDKIKVALAK